MTAPAWHIEHGDVVRAGEILRTVAGSGVHGLPDLETVTAGAIGAQRRLWGWS